MLSNYCGLGGSGRYRHKTDQACAAHDLEYQKYIKNGINPYIRYNKADREFLKQLERTPRGHLPENLINQLSKWFVKAKKVIAPRVADQHEAIINADGSVSNPPPIKKQKTESKS